MDQKKSQPNVNPTTERCLSGHNWKIFRTQVIEAKETDKVTSKENTEQNHGHKDHAHGKRTERHSQKHGKRKVHSLQKIPLTEEEKEIQENIQNGIVKHPHEMTKTRHVAMDCEMVGIGDGSENMIARVSIVNRYGYCIYDKYVKPREQVQDYRSAVSGVYPHHLETGIDFKIVQSEVAAILKGRILIGHAIKHDLNVLFLSHPRRYIRDTSLYKPFRQISMGNTPSLKKLACELLGREIQTGEHNSIEDARATMQLYMLYKNKWESEIFSR